VILKNLLEKNTLNFEDNFYEDCKIFIELLQKWGKVHNLSGRLDNENINENILDSLYPLKFIDSFSSFVDIGTGAGYPGLILAIVKKDIKSYLLEPRQKRVAFLNFVKASLDLKNLTILQKRAEDIENLKVDLITSRAVSSIKLLLEITKNMKKSNTSYLFYKGSMLKEELEETKITNYKIVSRDDRNYLYIKA